MYDNRFTLAKLADRMLLRLTALHQKTSLLRHIDEAMLQRAQSVLAQLAEYSEHPLASIEVPCAEVRILNDRHPMWDYEVAFLFAETVLSAIKQQLEEATHRSLYYEAGFTDAFSGSEYNQSMVPEIAVGCAQHDARTYCYFKGFLAGRAEARRRQKGVA